MIEKPNYYAVIPADVRYNKKLMPNAKLLYAEITALCNMNGKCTASTNYFCKLYEVSRVSIQKWLKCLEDNNFIKRKNIYKEDSKEIDVRYITLVNTPSKQKLPTSSKDMFVDNSNTKVYNNNNITYSNTYFKKPTISDISKYCIERKNNIDAEGFFSFYESKDWMVGKNKMKNWKQAIITWEKNQYKKPTMSKIDSQISQYEQAKKLL